MRRRRSQLNFGELDLAVATLAWIVDEHPDAAEAAEAAEDLAYARSLIVRRDALRAAVPLDEQGLFRRAVGVDPGDMAATAAAAAAAAAPGTGATPSSND